MLTRTGKELKTRTLICDIDGCLANWNDAFRALLESLHGPRTVQTLEAALQGWDWPKRLGYTNKEIDAAWEKVDWDWWYGLEPYPGAEESIARLSGFDGLEDSNDDFHVYYVTGRHASAKHASADWLCKMGACHSSVITCSRKAELARIFTKEGPVAVIEDKPTLLRAYWNLPDDIEAVNPLFIYCIDQPYNKGCYGQHFATVGEAVDEMASIFSLKTQTPPVTEAKSE